MDFGGRKLTDDELKNIFRTFVFAGFETTAHAIGSLVHHVVSDPDLQAGMRSGAIPLEGVVEEGLRMLPPGADHVPHHDLTDHAQRQRPVHR